ncbi:MAG TPA: hypothetical protein DDX85_13380 [Nitrospiraceae bacterium]|nr:hypothetical protein [Nitrospiraceae bacterium]
MRLAFLRSGFKRFFERSFKNTPPLIPHGITGMLPLERDNICMGCHMPEDAVFSGTTPIPTSHLTTFTTGEYLRGKLDGSKFNCFRNNDQRCIHRQPCPCRPDVSDRLLCRFQNLQS